MTRKEILFFADRLPPLIGGMEMHAQYFIDYFSNHLQFPISAIITKDITQRDCLISRGITSLIAISALPSLFDPAIVFFNSGRWIEELSQLRKLFPRAKFIYRTGGNEISKAPLTNYNIADHSLRQNYWVQQLNNSINLLITNSAYTETRLRKLGLNCLFERCVGGVNTSVLKLTDNLTNRNYPIIFCAARFVQYKNHSLMLSVIRALALKGYKFKLKLAGDGSLLKQAKEQVSKENLSSFVKFLGVLDNIEACKEIAKANIYMQFSKDEIIQVLGGSYIHSEGMGRSILEAITAGTYIIAGKSGALSEIITPNLGLLLDLNDLNKTTYQIEEVLKQPPSKLPFVDRFCWNKIFSRYEELFSTMTENK